MNLESINRKIYETRGLNFDYRSVWNVGLWLGRIVWGRNESFKSSC